MMKVVVGTRRIAHGGDLENWVDYVIRSTRAAEKVMTDLGQPDWVEEVHRRRFQWAGRTARLNDNRWTREVLVWSATGNRKRGRPKARWTDQLNKFFRRELQATNQFWMEIASEEASWASLENDYVNFALGMLSEV